MITMSVGQWINQWRANSLITIHNSFNNADPSSIQNTCHIWLAVHKDFDNADPSSVQDACHIWTQLNELALHETVLVSQWIQFLPCVWEVMGSIPFRVIFFSFCDYQFTFYEDIQKKLSISLIYMNIMMLQCQYKHNNSDLLMQSMFIIIVLNRKCL